jgi:hypothetical protein
MAGPNKRYIESSFPKNGLAIKSVLHKPLE